MSDDKGPIHYVVESHSEAYFALILGTTWARFFRQVFGLPIH